MWTTATRLLSFNGNVAVAMGSHVPQRLKGVMVYAYRFVSTPGGGYEFEPLANQQANEMGEFNFTGLPVPIQAQTVISGIPPYNPVEIINPASLPNIVFRIAVHAEAVPGAAVPEHQFIDIYDEREKVSPDWLAVHPERVNVTLSGAPPLEVLIPEEDAEYAYQLAEIAVSLPPGTDFRLLRIGRVIRDEIGELGDTRPDYLGKPGYMFSSNKRTVDNQPSFFPNQVDAPFGGGLQIGGQFGTSLSAPPVANNLYYKVSSWEYSGDPANPFNPAHLINETRILDPLFNKRYIMPNPTYPKGKWETLHLGPFDGTVGPTPVKVYKRPPLPVAGEYWPFWDLMAIWNTNTANNGLVILTLEAFQKTGGTDANPVLSSISIPTANTHLPLQIDNRRPVPRMFNFREGMARFSPSEEIIPGSVSGLSVCGDMAVVDGQPDRNECLIVSYSIEDGAGNPHPHLSSYGLGIEYSPRQEPGVPLSAALPLRGGGSNPPFITEPQHKDINGNYSTSMTGAPLYSVHNYESVLVPQALNGWPPEANGDTYSGLTPCTQYAAEVSLGCSVRTVNGWSRLFGSPHISRHIIIRRS